MTRLVPLTTAAAGCIAVLTLGPALADPPVQGEDEVRRDDAPDRAARVITRPARDSDAIAIARDGYPDTLEGALSEQIEKLIDHSRELRRGTTSICVVDAYTGAPVFELDADEPLNPASNVKLVSTATALDLLGPDFRYRTRILGAWPDRDGVVHGDLYLLGGWDPLLGQNDIDELAEKLADHQISRVEGDIVIGSDPARDGFYHPRLSVRVAASGEGDDDDELAVSVWPSPSFVDIDTSKVEIKRRGRWRLRGTWKRVEDPDPGAAPYRLEVSGTVREGKGKRFNHWIKDKPLLAAYVLRDALDDVGIDLGGTVRVEDLAEHVDRAMARDYLPVELALHRSIPLAKIVAKVNKRSINWLADDVIETAAAFAYGGRPDMELAVRAMERWLADRAGVDPEDVVIDTGSGLSYATQLSARNIVSVLRTAGGFATETLADPRARTFLSSLAVGGKDGTLRGRFRDSPTEMLVHGKTGTLTKVIALSGILEVEDQALAFAIVTNGHRHSRRRTVRSDHEELVEALYDYLRHRHTSP